MISQFVKKPWGQNSGEYTIYQNQNVEVKRLIIGAGHCTSLHCHPNKKTGLCVVKGLVKIDFLNDSFWLEPGDKIMIRQGVFHRTNAKLDSELLEIENPVNKDDLVRLEDKYGRNQGYETTTEEKEVPTFNYNTLTIGGCYITHDTNIPPFPEGKYMILNGGIYNVFNNQKVYVLGPGDLVDAKVVNSLAAKFTAEPMEVLYVRNI